MTPKQAPAPKAPMDERVAALEAKLRADIVDEYADVVCRAFYFDSYTGQTIHSVAEGMKKRFCKVAEAIYDHCSKRNGGKP